MGLFAEQLMSSTPGPAAARTTLPSAAAIGASSPLTSPEAGASLVPSAAPNPAPSPAAPVLEAEMPRSLNGTTLTIESATDAISLGSSPNNRALDAAMTSLGKTPADLEIADAYDASGSLTASVLGFRVAGVDPAKLRPLILEIWLSSTAPGATSSSVTLSDTTATKLSYGDGGPDEYVFIRGDSVFLVETTDQTLAVSAVAAMATPSGSPSPGS